MEIAKVESLKSGDLKLNWGGHKEVYPTHVPPSTFLHELLDFSGMVPNIVIIIKFLLLYT